MTDNINKADYTFRKIFGRRKDMSTVLSVVYGYPLWLTTDREVVKMLDSIDDTVSIEAVRNTLARYQDQLMRERAALEEAELRGRIFGEAKGRAEGEAKGRAEGVIATARNAKSLGIPSETIAQATGLTLAEIEAL